MLRGARQTQTTAQAKRTTSMIVFAIGGQTFAMKASEVASVEPWPIWMPVPSSTPFVHALVRRGARLYAVYNLAEQWELTPSSETPLCVMVKWGREEVALRVDSQIPSLENADLAMIHTTDDARPGVLGEWSYQGTAIPVISFMHLVQRVPQAA
ncbi:MAG: chemotaxis protein CheW [Nitrospiraceae bacterium]